MEVIYALDFSPKALKDVQFYKKFGDKGIIRKINTLLAELEQHPLTGTGRLLKSNIACNSTAGYIFIWV